MFAFLGLAIVPGIFGPVHGLQQPGFQLTTDPSLLLIYPGNSDNSTITVSSLNGFAGTVSVAASSSDVITSLSGSQVTISPGINQSFTLTVTVPPSKAPGSYAVNVSGAYTTLAVYNSTSVPVYVPPPTYKITTNPSSLLISRGGTETAYATLTSLHGFSGTVNFKLTPSTGITATITPPAVPLTIGGTATARLNVTVLQSDMRSLGYVIINGTSGSVFETDDVPVLLVGPGPDFSLSASTPNLSIPAGASTSSTITITPISGFTETVSLTATISPTGPTLTLTSSRITGGAGTSTLTIDSDNGLQTGIYLATVQGSSGARIHSALLQLNVTAAGSSDFSIAANPSLLSIQSIGSIVSTITITSSNGFEGTVGLTANVQPTTFGSGGSLTFSNVNVLSGSGTSTLTIGVANTAVVGTYSITVTGRSGSLQHSQNITLTITAAGQPAAPSSPSTLGLSPSVFYMLLAGVAVALVGGSIVVVLRMRKPS